MKHCDDYIDDPSTPEPLRKFLARERLPAVMKTGEKPVLFATLKEDQLWNIDSPPIPAGTLIRVVMASRLGDVGITPYLDKEYGYVHRCAVEELENFTDTLPTDGPKS